MANPWRGSTPRWRKRKRAPRKPASPKRNPRPCGRAANIERAESIRNSGALSTEAIESRRAAALAADARLAAARAQLQEVNARLGGGYVRAPAAGLVIDRTAEVGRSVDGQILFRIAAGNRLEVAAQVAEGEALALERRPDARRSHLVDGTTVASHAAPPARFDRQPHAHRRSAVRAAAGHARARRHVSARRSATGRRAT